MTDGQPSRPLSASQKKKSRPLSAIAAIMEHGSIGPK